MREVRVPQWVVGVMALAGGVDLAAGIVVLAKVLPLLAAPAPILDNRQVITYFQHGVWFCIGGFGNGCWYTP